MMGSERRGSAKPLVLAINGERVEVAQPDPRMTLLTFIRTCTRFKGTKLACGEGGCGACVVVVSAYDPVAKRVEERSMASCLAPLCSLHLCAVTTTEGLKTQVDAYGPPQLHPVQRRLAGFHATQCGFCAPGAGMALYGCLRRAGPEGLVSAAQAERAVQGTLCRCTGYRPLLDACKSFAGDVDLEDLGVNAFWGGGGGQAREAAFPAYRRDMDPQFPRFLRRLAKKEGVQEREEFQCVRWEHQDDEDGHCQHLQRPRTVWVRVRSMRQLGRELRRYHHQPEGGGGSGSVVVRLVAGNTGAAVVAASAATAPADDEEEEEEVRDVVMVDISGVRELVRVERTHEYLEVGAAVTLTTLIAVLQQEAEADDGVHGAMAAHLERVGNPHVRHWGSVGGNLVLARQGLPQASDLATLLLAAGASVKLATLRGTSCSTAATDTDDDMFRVATMSVEEFLEQPGGLAPATVLLSVLVPVVAPATATATATSSAFKAFRASARPQGNAPAYVTAAFWAQLQRQQDDDDGDGASLVVTIKDVRVALGAFGRGPGAAAAVVARDVQRVLAGQRLTPRLLLRAVEALKRSVVPAGGTHKAAYRSSVLVGYLFHFFRPFLNLGGVRAGDVGLDHGDGFGDGDGVEGLAMEHEEEDDACAVADVARELHHRLSLEENSKEEDPDAAAAAAGAAAPESVTLKFGNSQRPAPGSASGTPAAAPAAAGTRTVSGSQKIAVSKVFFTVGDQQEQAVAAELQASGETLFVADLSLPPRCLHAALVVSARACTAIVNMDASRALTSPGAVALVTAADIPHGGLNVGPAGDEPLLATTRALYHGQPLGVLVAETAAQATAAARLVRVTYGADAAATAAAITTAQAAVAAGCVSAAPPVVAALTPDVGDVDAGFARAEVTIHDALVACGPQYPFALETQSAMAVPDEDGQVTVYSACQSTESVQRAVARCLGAPLHSVRVVARRVGGGFGGKLGKAAAVAAACALAARALRRPVALHLDRATDTLLAGGRAPVLARYSVGFTRAGAVTALRTHVTLDCGAHADYWTGAVAAPVLVHSGTKQYNWRSFAASYALARTHTAAKTPLRGAGDLQGAFIAETVVQHVAAALGIPARAVREANLHDAASARLFYGAATAGADGGRLVWARLLASAEVAARERRVARFNARNRWRKRGLAVVPVAYGVAVARPKSPARVTVLADGSVVVQVPGTEMGQGLWSRVRLAAAAGLTQGGVRVGVGRVRVVAGDSVSTGNAGGTAGGTASEGTCEAVAAACAVLAERLRPIKRRIDYAAAAASTSTPTTWAAVVAAARASGVDLSVQTDASAQPPQPLPRSYVNFGAGVSEVEIDVVTGATVTLRADLLYDGGSSVNPAVDVGQAEGAFVQGMGFFLTEDVEYDGRGRHAAPPGTWSYLPPAADNIPRVFNVHLMDAASAPHTPGRVLSSKSAGEPPLLLASSVHCAVREAVSAARRDSFGDRAGGFFRLDSCASMDRVKTLCGLDNVERFLASVVQQDEEERKAKETTSSSKEAVGSVGVVEHAKQ